tara:strand:- start:4619 stop:4912 length:294 start_codon:yes stop_codon:yes gene_type:complete
MDRHLAIRNIHENVGVINGDNDAWDLEGNKITINEDLVTKEMARLQAEFDAIQYQRDRQLEYPNLQDCIHALLDGGDTLTELQTKRSKIKQKYPKPT